MPDVLHGRPPETVEGEWGRTKRAQLCAHVAPPGSNLAHTQTHKQLDTVCRVLLDRKWTVGELAAATLQNAQHILEAPNDVARRSECLFEKLIGLY